MLGIVETVAGVVDNVLDKFIEDKDLKTKLNHELKKSVQDANLLKYKSIWNKLNTPASLLQEQDLLLCGSVVWFGMAVRSSACRSMGDQCNRL